MFRKILASVLCLMLVLALPLTSLAATSIALKVIPGAELASANENVQPILDSLILRIVAEDNSGMLALESKKGEVASAGIRADENGIYVASAFLGDRTLYFTMEDVSAFVVEMMRQNGVDEATIAEFEMSMAQITSQAQAATGTSITSLLTEGDDVVDEDAYEAMYANDPVMQQFIQNIENKLVVTEGNFTDATFNAATTKTELVMTSEDILILMDSEMIREMYGSMAQSAGMTVDELIATVKDVFTQLDMNYNIVAYTNGDDLCAMQMDMIMKGDVTLEVTDQSGNTTTDTATFDMVMDMDVNVLTTAEVDNTAVTVLMTDNADANANPIGFVMNISEDDSNDVVGFDGMLNDGEVNVLQFKGAFIEEEDDAVNGWLGILAEEQQVTFAVTGKETNDVYEGQLAIYVRPDSTAIVEPTWSDNAVITFAMQKKEVATPDLLKQLNSATPETSVQLLRMNQDEFSNEISAISGDAVSAFFLALGNLPSELMTLVMTAVPMQ